MLRQQLDQLESEKGVLLDYVQESVEKTNRLNKEVVELESINKKLMAEKSTNQDEKLRSQDEVERLVEDNKELHQEIERRMAELSQLVHEIETLRDANQVIENNLGVKEAVKIAVNLKYECFLGS